MQDLGASTLSRRLTKEDEVQAFFLHVYVSKSLVVRAWENVGDLGIRRDSDSDSDSAILPLSSCCQSCIRAVGVGVVNYACVYAMQVIDTWMHRVVVASWTIGVGVAPRSLLFLYMQQGLLAMGA